MWALLAVTPSVQMTRIDVGGNRAGTQTGYTAYGFTGQVRVLIEGINTTEGTGGAGFYFDYSSLEEVFLGTSGQSAEMPNPGVQSQFIAKSGGNQFNGEYYLDWYNNSLQGSNIPRRSCIARGIRPHSNEIDDVLRHRDQRRRSDQARQDLVVRHLPHAEERGRAAELPLRQDVRHQAVEPGRQGHLPGDPEQQVHRLLPVGPEDAAQPPALRHLLVQLAKTTTNRQDSGSWVYKGEWNGTLSDKLYVEARYGDFGYYFPLIANGDEQYFWRDTGAADARRARSSAGSSIATASSGPARRPTSSTPPRGSHTLKFGGEMLQGAGLGRLRAAVRRQHRSPVRQRRLEHGGVHAADGHAGGQPRSDNDERQPDVAVGARTSARSSSTTPGRSAA